MLKNKNIVLGITGSIAAYKAADIASKLVQAGARVDVVMTESAQKFIAPLTLRALTNRPPVTSMWEDAREFSIEHVTLAETADVVLIAPATANTIAKLACGLADDMLSSTVLATRAPVIIAPAMNCNMYENATTQENIKTLKSRGFIFVEPESGRLACGTEGKGRLAATETILAAVDAVLNRKADLAGKTVVVTAGGTREPLDPVRYIGNRSSGKMGYALAAAARDRGASVKLISTVDLPDTSRMDVIRVETAAGMLAAVKEAVKGAYALIMAAAVADFRPATFAGNKIKKNSATLDLKMERTPDILAEVQGDFIRIGFAAETADLIANAKKKLAAKNLDLIVANDVTAEGSGFGADTNKVTLLFRDGHSEDLPLMSKREIAEHITDKIYSAFKELETRTTILSILTPEYINSGWLNIPARENHLFPDQDRAVTIASAGKEFTAVFKVYRTYRGFSRLRQWYKIQGFKNGDQIEIKIISPDKYQLGLNERKSNGH